MTKEQCRQLLSGNYTFLKSSNDQLFLELYAKIHYQQLRPKSIVDYRREAYIYPISNVRITIDRHILGSDSYWNFFDQDVQGIPLADAIILEIKYDEFLPQIIRDITQIDNRHAAAFSKYAIARMA